MYHVIDPQSIWVYYDFQRW